MWLYHQATGELYHNGAFAGLGYSGTGWGRNNPAAQNVAERGPLPCGKYKIGKAYTHPHLGPCVMNLDPLPETDTFGRSAFRIHGNNAANDASHGCIVSGPANRHEIDASNDDDLEVVA